MTEIKNNTNIELKSTKDKGKGVYAKRDFLAGEIVLGFKGKITGKRSKYTVQISSTEHILTEKPERYVNHSCNPNCEITNKVYLAAIRNINAGEEITFDYTTTETEVIGFSKCLCGSPNCRKKM